LACVRGWSAIQKLVFNLAIPMAAAESQDRLGSSNGPEGAYVLNVSAVSIRAPANEYASIETSFDWKPRATVRGGI
jgi:hypothetical protein